MKEVIVDAEDLVCLNKEKLQELIRCKDCMYYNPDPWGYGLCECKDYRRVNEKDFCSWGERKEKDGK